LEHTFLTYLKNTLAIPENAGILLAISGGVDSMCMLRLFERSNYRIMVAHVNFQLRSEDSLGDELMIKNYCSKHKIGFQSIKFDTLKYAKENKVSTQMAARELRYPWFESLLAIHQLDFVATAHHSEDSLETALLNLVRGTGLSGLKGILPKQGRLIRPLLFAKKDEIMEFAKREAIEWREDSSNASDKYKRNFIRHQVIPLLKELNPKATENFQNTSKRVSSALNFIEEQKRRFVNKHVKNHLGFLCVVKKVFFHSNNEVLITSWLEDFGFNYTQITDILHAEKSLSGTQFASNSHILIIDREVVSVDFLNEEMPVEILIDKSTIEIDNAFCHLDFQTRTEFPSKDLLINTSKAFLDLNKLKYPLILRPWKQGDRFIPYGMKGSKLVSDYLIDEKISMLIKPKILVLCSGEDIVWLMNYRVSAIAAIDKNSNNILVINYTAN
jgi:tRNA(Ile)-lysidine synthase